MEKASYIFCQVHAIRERTPTGPQHWMVVSDDFGLANKLKEVGSGGRVKPLAP